MQVAKLVKVSPGKKFLAIYIYFYEALHFCSLFYLQILAYLIFCYLSSLIMTGVKRKRSSMKASLTVKYVSSPYLAQSALGYFHVNMCTVETVSLHTFLQRSLKEMLQQLTAQAVAAHP